MSKTQVPMTETEKVNAAAESHKGWVHMANSWSVRPLCGVDKVELTPDPPKESKGAVDAVREMMEAERQRVRDKIDADKKLIDMAISFLEASSGIEDGSSEGPKMSEAVALLKRIAHKHYDALNSYTIPTSPSNDWPMASTCSVPAPEYSTIWSGEITTSCGEEVTYTVAPVEEV